MLSLRRSHGIFVPLVLVALLAACAAPAPDQPQSQALPGAAPSPETELLSPLASPDSSPASVSETVTLSYAFPDEPSARASAEALSDGFARQEPRVRLHLEPLPAATYPASLTERIESGAPPDLFMLVDQQVPALRARDALLDLAPFGINTNNALPTVVSPWRDGERVLGMPYHAIPTMLFYNRALFDDDGIVYPDASMTWQNWRMTAHQLSDPARGLFGTTMSGWDALVWGNGGDLVSSDLRKTLLDTPEAAAGVQFGADMINLDGSAPLPLAADGPEPSQLFRAGKVAMLVAPSNFIASLQHNPPGFEWGIAPLPEGPAGRVTRLTVSGVAASASTRHPAEAAGFIGWAGSTEGLNADIAAMPFAVPAHSDVLPALLLQPEGGLLGGAYVVEALDYGRLLPPTPAWPKISQIVNSALKPVWQGQESASAAYSQVAPEINQLLAK